MNGDLCDLGVADLTAGFASGDFSPVEVTSAVIERIDQHDDKVNAFVRVHREDAMRAAQAAKKRWRDGAPLGPIDGIATTVKELLPVAGWPARRCSQATPADGVADFDAAVVARLREAGAVLIGQTNSPEFGWKGTTDNLLYGATSNPWAPDHTAGGSSGGAAAAAALGMGVLHIGTDGGGSVRIPAAFCGIFGIKPTVGRVPVRPASRFGATSHIGPMTRTVTDAAHMLTVMSQPDAHDAYARPRVVKDYTQKIDGGVAGLRIGLSTTFGGGQADSEVVEKVRKAAEIFAQLGAAVEEIDHVIDDPAETFRRSWATSLALTMDAFPPESWAEMEPAMVELADYGRSLGPLDFARVEYARAVLSEKMREFHTRYDLLLTPTEPVAAFPIDQQVPKPGQRDWIDWTPFTYPFNLTGQPAASIPCGLTEGGLPVGLQVIGGLDRDDLVLRACFAFEQQHPFQRPPMLAVAAS